MRYPDHAVFDAFSPFRGERPSGILIDYIGARFEGTWVNQSVVPPRPKDWTAPTPDFDEEYFEWIDILESVRASGDTYTMLELGAGFGRWGIRAGLAARTQGVKDIHLVFVESEPKHVQWLYSALANNGLTQRSTVHENAISYSGSSVPFLIGHDHLDVGFGQCLGWEGEGTATEQRYFGKPVARSASGYHQISVPPTTLEAVTEGLGVIDLIDMDLQRAELELVQNSMDVLNHQVRRVHIGTHGPEIEATIRDRFASQGWKCVWDFGCHQTNATPYGEITFVDGVQSWINPRLV